MHIPQLDYLKGIFIILMILFHLVYIGDNYPYMKQVVYTFHMPVFLILSGFLSSARKSGKEFLCSMWWIFFPYAVLEAGYVIASSFLPVREYVGEMSLCTILTKIFMAPVGPYWYLHTLIICRLCYYLIVELVGRRFSPLSFLIVLGLCYWGVSEIMCLMSFSYSMYFLIGVGIKTYEVKFQSFFQPSVWSVVPLIILCSKQENLLGLKLSCIIITYLVISFSLWICPKLPKMVELAMCTIGRNTMVLLLFSPLFTMLSRMYQPIFMFDPSGCCFAFFTIAITISGCLAITWCMDKCRLSQWFFGKEKMLK